MKLKSVAIDDVPLALDLIKLYAQQIPELELVKTFDDAIAGLEYLQKNPVDLLFLDINMPDISGLELVKALQKKPLLIFTTAYKNFAFEGFELEALDYLLKPIEFDRFSKAVQKAVEVYTYKNSVQAEIPESFFVYSEYQAVKINIHEIEFIESLKNYLQIHLLNSKPVLTAMSLKKIQEKLPKDKFLRIHRSYIVPATQVRSILNRKVLLNSGKELPIGDSFFDMVQQWKKS
jgi:DNA-binding LytR/AlgR family response regulator